MRLSAACQNHRKGKIIIVTEEAPIHVCYIIIIALLNLSPPTKRVGAQLTQFPPFLSPINIRNATYLIIINHI